MKKHILLLAFIVIPFFFIHAQNLSISGHLIGQSNQALYGATVILLHPNDSSQIKGVTTDVYGKFKIEKVQPGKFLIKISYIGYEDAYLLRELSDRPLILGKLVLKEKAIKLNEVSIKTVVTAVIQKDDTTQINAAAFKTNPDANAEDLVTKMPGITMKDGKVQAQGEDVQKVLVDGQTFFGDDASAVLKNLPAEVIDKIQIFDKKSEQSELTGFDDGNSSKTLNIITKTQFKNGTFGKIYAGYAYKDKWKGGLNLNFFKNKRRISILANSNNLNDQNFSSEDLLGVMSSGSSSSGKRGGGRPSGGSNDAGNFLVDSKNGITTTHAFGINYADQWKKVAFTGSYFLNYSDNNSNSDLFRQYISNENVGLSYKEKNESNGKNTNHRLNLKFEWVIDSFNSITFQPKFSIQQNDGKGYLFGENKNLSIPLSNTSNDYTSNLSGINFSTPLFFRHSFTKRGRSFSLKLSPGYNQNNGNSHRSSFTTYFNDTITVDSLNQLANRDVQGYVFSSNIMYSEPINDKSQLMFSYGTNFNKSESNIETFNFSVPDYSYNAFDTSLSNKYSSQYLSHSLGANYRFQQKKWNISTGISFQYANLKGEQIFPYSFNLDKTFSNLLPNAQFQYKFSSKKNLRIMYRSSNNAPSVSQLQNVINNSNPLQISSGNPDLKQDWRNSITLRYTSANTEKSKSFFAMLSGSNVRNYIVNNNFIASKDTFITPEISLARGSQFSKPINLNGYFNIRSFNNYTFPLTKIKSKLNLNLGGVYSRSPGMINNSINYSNNYNVGLGFVLSSNISEKFDFTLSSNSTYNNISNTMQSGLNSNYYNQNSKLKIQLMLWKGLVIQTDINHQYNSGLSANYNQNYILWNAAIGYKFLKNNAGEFRLTVFDIMKQNKSITRNTTETYYEDVQTNVLEQYLLLSFTYNIKSFKETKKTKK